RFRCSGERKDVKVAPTVSALVGRSVLISLVPSVDEADVATVDELESTIKSARDRKRWKFTKSISACRLPMRMVTRFLFWAEEEESSYRGIGKQWGSYPPDLVLSSKGKVAEGTLRKRTQPLRADGIGRSARITGKRSSRISGQGIQWR
ncbi:hypothetical protein BHM03_00045368, partial [Ensete ventricosum]